MPTPLSRKETLALYLLVCFGGSVGLTPQLRASGGDDQTPSRMDTVRVQRIVDDLKGRLAITQAVTVSIVDRNPLIASVGPASGGGFVLSFEAGFAEQLTDDELTAAVAHELGHVWIYTHFPFLQTEQLANEIAMRVVSRESLVPVYAQMFQRVRANGDLNDYLGDPHSTR
jgi:predicted Zn-dependent protease